MLSSFSGRAGQPCKPAPTRLRYHRAATKSCMMLIRSQRSCCRVQHFSITAFGVTRISGRRASSPTCLLLINRLLCVDLAVAEQIEFQLLRNPSAVPQYLQAGDTKVSACNTEYNALRRQIHEILSTTGSHACHSWLRESLSASTP